MDNATLTNTLISILIILLGFIGGKLYMKLEQFSKVIQDILISDMGNKKDIQRIDGKLVEHEKDITELKKIA